MTAPKLTLTAAAITRRLRTARLGVIRSYQLAEGALRVYAYGTAEARAIAAHLIQLGYDAAAAGDRVTVTLPEPTEKPTPAEPVELPAVQPVPETGGEIRQTEHGARYYTAAELLTRRDEAREAAGLPPVRTEGYTRKFRGYLVRNDGEAIARRFYKSEGAAFSGWIVSDPDQLGFSDPIPTAEEAIATLLQWEC